MSAVPQVPEHVHNARESMPDAMSKGLRNKEALVEHIEDAYPLVSNLKNGVKSENSVNSVVNGDTDNFSVHDTAVENFRPVKVIVIGAGYSGIYHGIRIPERIKNCELVIYEKNAGVGGTWYVS